MTSGPELRRRGVHASGVGFPALYMLGLVDWQTLRYLLVFAAVVAAVLETIRLLVGLDWQIYETLTREYERDNVAGYALYMFSMTAVAWVPVFDPPVAVAGMLMLAIGDPVSGLLGSNEAGRAKRAGVIAAMFVVCFSLGVLALTPSITLPVAVVAAAVGGAGATVADGFTPVVRGYVLDDNLTIPPAACVGIWVVLRVLA
ncbi:Dolichol kinase [Haloplanus vescus]|mgnify:CR=1 FL=1|uniref:Dolichol kinase n=1 Tax=Haloplanus vescus TaxID=555874 RepID=A0A1H3Z1G2_9EURY|nr:dolichol kinase [Haloplanus vescus]SEA17516.1 Dolichol kinase [Haloplanus vescus]